MTDLNIGQRIQEIRLSTNFTQEEFSAMLDMSTKHLSNIERGNKSLTLESAILISRLFNVSLDYLIFGKTPSSDIIRETAASEEFENTELSKLLKICSFEEQEAITPFIHDLLIVLRKQK